MRAISLTQADIYKGELILVNAEHPYFENLAKPNLVPAASGNADILLEQNTATHLSQVMEKINGWQQIVPVSGWRSLKEQQDTALPWYDPRYGRMGFYLQNQSNC